MKLVAKTIDLKIKGEDIILSEETATRLGVSSGDRVNLTSKGKTISTFIGVSSTLVEDDEVGVLGDIKEDLKINEKEEIEVRPSKKPKSVSSIKNKVLGNKFTKEDLKTLVNDVVNEKLTNSEIAAYLTAISINGMDLDETYWLTKSMVETGDQIDFEEFPIMDKHSIGGVPGNKISLLIVPIIAAAGLKIPKTSSRAITGAAGTADIMEVLAPVKFSAEQIHKITNEVGGTLAWGGATNIAPADDIFVRVEHPLSLDPRPQLLASVLSKKKAIGSDKIVIDIPTGDGTKVENKEEAKKLARDFIELGNRFEIEIESAITYGGTPIGHAIGPALEAQEGLMALEGKKEAPKSLLEKSCSVAGILLEMGDKADEEEGKKKAKKLLKNGKALEKFKEIIEVQGGDPQISSQDIELGAFRKKLVAPSSGYVTNVDNQGLIKIARTLGAPADKGAGLRLYKKEGDEVEEGEKILELFSEEKWKLKEAKKSIKKNFPLDVEGILLKRMPEFEDIQ
ncbi:AMP phosphorylase [archaeon SCG-AAA382B04]|nr:AMP phosphorylase [archaeon SCG-AAA382B04]